SDLTRSFTLFDLATPTHNNDFHIFKMNARDEINVDVRNVVLNFKGQDYQINTWQSICGTWDAASGLVQLWVDGKPSSMKFATNSHIHGIMLIVLGQDQDSYGGSFDKARSFVGMISDMHMWDYVLSPIYIYRYSQKFTFPGGNVLNWNSIDFHITDRVLIQEEQHL
ncbi:serum amyloid P-component-like, partial [Boleophthalmus pectinirostris]|uniref:serum amyloid P-component-like n=1 Tax=Boleophthalmus pectinirostris TaxID=150288 RepID=UPI002432824E